MGLEGGGTEEKKEKEEEEKISHMCESIGHRPLRGLTMSKLCFKPNDKP